jgi:esterase/lipase
MLIVNHHPTFHPKMRKNILQLKYSSTEDLWFRKEGNKKLVVFLHGMYSTPSTFETLAILLLEKGFDVYAPSLPASALTLEELKIVGPWTWEESLFIINYKLDLISQDYYEKTILGGHSQGGSLAMTVVTERDFDALIVVASPTSLYGTHLKLYENIAIYLSGLLSFVLPRGLFEVIPYQQERAKIEKLCDAEGINYPYTIYTFKEGLKTLRKNLYKIEMPMFLTYCKGDTLVNFKNLEFITSHVSSTKIVIDKYDISFEEEPYGFRHQLLNYSKTRDHLNASIVSFLEDL